MSIHTDTNNLLISLCDKYCPQSETCQDFCETAIALRAAIEWPIDDAISDMRKKPYPDEV